MLVDAWAVASGRSAVFDRTVLIALSDGPTPLWAAITHAGDPLVRLIAAAGGIGLLAWRTRDWRGPAIVAGAIALGLVLTTTLKGWMARPRPTILPRLVEETSASWPSGHALNAAVVWLLLALTLAPPRWRGRALAAAVMLAGLTGVSRLALAVHWPSDVIAGWALGGAIVLAALPALQACGAVPRADR